MITNLQGPISGIQDNGNACRGSTGNLEETQMEESSLHINDEWQYHPPHWAPCLPSWQLKALMARGYQLSRVRTSQHSDEEISKKHSWALWNVIVQIFVCVMCVFLGPHPRHMEVPRLGSNQSCSRWSTPEPQQCQIQASSSAYTTTHSNTRSLTHWVRPGVEPGTSWFLVGFVSDTPWWELHSTDLMKDILGVRFRSQGQLNY